MLGAFEDQPINSLGYFEARGVRQDDSKSVVIKIYVSQNSINILGHDAQTKLSVSIDPTKFGSFSSTAFSTQNPPGCTQCECRTFQFCSGHCVTMKDNLILNDDVTPKFCKLPFAMRPVVGDEHDQPGSS